MRKLLTCLVLAWIAPAGAWAAAPLCGPPAGSEELLTPGAAAERTQEVRVQSRGRLYLELGLPAAVDLASTEIKLATDPTARERNKLLFGGGRAGRIGYNVGATVVGAELARLLQKAGIGWGAKVVKATSIGVHGAAVVLTWR